MKKIVLISFAVLFFSGGIICAKKSVTSKTDKTSSDTRIQEIKDSLNLIMDKAKAGDAEAMNEVGTWYYTGKHVDQDYSEAYEWWKKASLKSDIRAIANLGLCYQLGHGVKKDSVDAIRLYEKSIKDGNSALLSQRTANASKSAFDAMLSGACYENGIGCQRDYLKAAGYYAEAAKMGSVEGMRQAGLCYLNAQENGKALPYFEQAAAKGDISSEFWAGKMLMGGMDVPSNKQQGVVYLLKAAEAGMPAAQAEMGTLYSEGNGVAKSSEQAARWITKSALAGNPKGMWNYGLILKDGKGVSQNYEQSLFWMAQASADGYKRSFQRLITELDSIGNDPFVNYARGMKLYLIDGKMKEADQEFRKVAKAGYPEGKIMQAMVLASNRNEKPNAKKAAKELEKLSSTNPEAMFYLATLYEAGNGVPKDMSKALDLYQKAADKGNSKALCYLGDLYYEGRGTEKNIEKAVELYQLALQNNQLSPSGYVRLAECYENGLGGLEKDKKFADKLRKENKGDKVSALLSETSF